MTIQLAVFKWKNRDSQVVPKWPLSSEQYIKETIQNMEHDLSKQNKMLKKNKEKLDTSPLLDVKETNCYQIDLSKQNKMLNNNNKLFPVIVILNLILPLY